MDAKKVTPLWPDGVWKTLSRLVSPENSPAVPKLIETADTPGRFAAVANGDRDQVAKEAAVRFDEDDIGLGRDRVDPFHIEGFLDPPTGL